MSIVLQNGKVPETRAAILPLLKKASIDGREAALRHLIANGSGLECAGMISNLQDNLIALVHRMVTQAVYPTTQQEFAVAAVGGYGRSTLAPGSDIDLLFLLSVKAGADARKAVEFLLYILWDLGFKVGHATRLVEECIRLSRTDMTIRTAILETRFICGKRCWSASCRNGLTRRWLKRPRLNSLPPNWPNVMNGTARRAIPVIWSSRM